MTTRFSKQKLAEAQEKKAKGGIISGLLSNSKKDSVMTIPPTDSPAKHPASFTSSLEMIASGGEEIKKKKKASGKSFLPTFWGDVDTAALKAYEALSVDDLSPLMAKSSCKALGESLFVSGKLLDLEKKVATSEPLVKSLFAENETLKNKVSILTAEAKNDKERMDFKDFDEYSDALCKYYVEGFDLLVKWMAKHHLSLDLSSLAMDDVEKELLSIEAITENVTEEATDKAEGMKEATVITRANPILDKQ
nr:hypothetical protein CFP56_48155 [Quercus suber]